MPREGMGHWEVRQVRALAVALAQACLTSPLSVNLPRAAAGPEFLVGKIVPLAPVIFSHCHSHPEMSFVMRALVGTPTTAQVCSARFHTGQVK